MQKIYIIILAVSEKRRYFLSLVEEIIQMTSKQLAKEFGRNALLCEEFVNQVESSYESDIYKKEYTIISKDGCEYRLIDVT